MNVIVHQTSRDSHKMNYSTIHDKISPFTYRWRPVESVDFNLRGQSCLYNLAIVNFLSSFNRVTLQRHLSYVYLLSWKYFKYLRWLRNILGQKSFLACYLIVAPLVEELSVIVNRRSTTKRVESKM